MAIKKETPAKAEKERPIDKIPSAESEDRKEADIAQAGKPGYVTTDEGPGKRYFQTGPDEHKWLTQAEAEKAGFYWKPDAPVEKKKG